jgi:DNA-binding response OmpR family regulator
MNPEKLKPHQTGRTETEEYNSRGFKLGAVYYIHKPFSLLVLQAAIVH